MNKNKLQRADGKELDLAHCSSFGPPHTVHTRYLAMYPAAAPPYAGYRGPAAPCTCLHGTEGSIRATEVHAQVQVRAGALASWFERWFAWWLGK